MSSPHSFLDADFRKFAHRIQSITPRVISELLSLLINRVKSGWNNRNLIASFDLLQQKLSRHPCPDESYKISNGNNLEAALNFQFEGHWFLIPIIRGVLICYGFCQDYIVAVNCVCAELNVKYGKGGNTKYGTADIRLLQEQRNQNIVAAESKTGESDRQSGRHSETHSQSYKPGTPDWASGMEFTDADKMELLAITKGMFEWACDAAGIKKYDREAVFGQIISRLWHHRAQYWGDNDRKSAEGIVMYLIEEIKHIRQMWAFE